MVRFPDSSEHHSPTYSPDDCGTTVQYRKFLFADFQGYRCIGV